MSPTNIRGRVFATMESMVWSTMMISMMLAGIASQYYDPRVYRRGCRSAQFHHGHLLGLGELDWPAARARAGGRASGGDGSAWRTHHLSLQDKVVLVTGAAKRIGRGIALRLAREGARVAIHYGNLGSGSARDRGGVRRSAALSRKSGKRGGDRSACSARLRARLAGWTDW